MGFCQEPAMRNRYDNIIHKPAGFTVVELLVVVGIVAIMVALLMPSLNNARRQARQVVCAAQMRQIYQAILMYCHQSKDVLPGPCYTGVGIPQGFPGGKYPDGTSTGYSIYGLAGALIGASNILPAGAYPIFGCPSAPDTVDVSVQRYVNTFTTKSLGGVAPSAPLDSYPVDAPDYRSYAILPFGTSLATPPFTVVPPRKMAQLGRMFGVSSSRIWLVHDTFPWHGKLVNSYSDSYWNMPQYSIDNALCADGHVEAKKYNPSSPLGWWSQD
jgi:type II secretory pathway pseudopilin PulG